MYFGFKIQNFISTTILTGSYDNIFKMYLRISKYKTILTYECFKHYLKKIQQCYYIFENSKQAIKINIIFYF